MDGNVSWMCWPRFDSSSIFGSMLDPENGGNFKVGPALEDYKSNQTYLGNTNILVTEFLSSDGAFRVTDFAPRHFHNGRYMRPLMLCRKLEPLSGSPQVRVSCQPRGDYGKIKTSITETSECLHFDGLERPVRLYTDISFTYVKNEQAFTLNKPVYMILTWSMTLDEPIQEVWENHFQQTRFYWEQWVFRTSIGPVYQTQVIRSALTLKLHQFEDTGAVIAASTTSLPESPGSSRTWDYRYCWLRDTFYTLKALNGIGHFDELVGYANFVQNIAVSETGGFQPVYAISGESQLSEKLLDLPGYLGNQPVRVGNQAFEHIQNDVYGQVLVSLLPLFIDERFTQHGFRTPSLKLVRDTLTQIEKRIDEADAGLWEFRNKAHKFCYTYLFHWAGAYSALKIARKFKDEDMADRAQVIIQKANDEIQKCYRPHLGAYAMSQDTDLMDSSLFHLVTLGYLDPKSELARNQIDVLSEKLHVDESGLFYRYKHADDFGKPESAFLICSFWYVEALACVGRIGEATTVFEKLLKYSNHLGLFSEDVDPRDGAQWGNFPQTYSHVGLMNAAFRIAQKLDRPIFL
jgi:GH15 family glucan-1,4-alpha-glucosidase